MSVEPRTRTASVPDEGPDAPAPSRHGPVAQLLIAWSPLSAILLVYWVAQWISAPLHPDAPDADNRVGAPLHVLGPARADEWLFGAVPSAWLQQRLVDGEPHWWDVLAAPLYVTHFVAIPLLTAYAWFALRARFRQWVTMVLSMTVLGAMGYVAYPAAPPWMAAEAGAIDAVHRLSLIGWEPLGLDSVARLVGLGQEGSNPVAAMPSLHAAAALIVMLFLWPSVTRTTRLLLVAYALAMGVVLVYSGEHYVVDVLAGWLVAVASVLVVRVVGSPRSSLGPAASPTLPDGGGPDGRQRSDPRRTVAPRADLAGGGRRAGGRRR